MTRIGFVRLLAAGLTSEGRQLFIALIFLAFFNGASSARAEDAREPESGRSPSFRQDVVPILTRFGCNAGSCHGKLAGQNGFKLSLRGYAPEMDYDSLTADLGSRRIDFANPRASLLLAKPLGKVPHEGGKRFADDSRAAKVLLDWINARAPGVDAADADPTSLEVQPGDESLGIGQAVQLTVKARYPDGRVRDVTWLTQFFSNDESTVSVTPDGLAKALRHGAAAVRAHFQGLVEVITFTIPYDNAVDPAVYSSRNNFVDEHVMAKLAALHLPPSERCDDATFIRRAFLDTIGALPSADEVRTFLADDRADKRTKLIDDLLARPQFVDYWTQQLADLLQNRKERDHDVRGVKGVRAFHAWLRQQVAANRPWDQIARDVITATGDVVHEPQVGYYVTTVGENRPEQSDVVDSVAQAFLGTRVGCARCHNHPLERYTQDDYYRFAAFFSQMTIRRQNAKITTTELVAHSDREDQQLKRIGQLEDELAKARKSDGKDADKKIADATKHLDDARKELARIQSETGVTQPRTGKHMSPAPLDRSAIRLTPGEDPRQALAAWITDPKNPNFSGAMINRLWKHFMGVGIVEPVDDLRSSNPPSNPALWKALNEEFVSHGFDLREMMRTILNSRTYQLGSSTLAGNEQDHRFYSHYFVRRLPAEVLSDAIASATGVPDAYPGYPQGVRATQLPDPGVESYFLTIFGRPERVTACACERSAEVTLPQLLYLNNGDDLQARLRSPECALSSMLKDNLPDDAIIDRLFLTTVSRPPTDAQRSAAKAALAGGDPRADVHRDLLWALINSKEFTFNH